MSERVHVASRKGLFTLERDGGWHIARVDFLGDNCSAVMSDSRDGSLYVALDHGHFGVKLHRSEDRGGSWVEVKAPSFENVPGDKPDSKAPSVHQVWELAAGGADEEGALWAGTIPGALFRSADRGESCHETGSYLLNPHATIKTELRPKIKKRTTGASSGTLTTVARARI